MILVRLGYILAGLAIFAFVFSAFVVGTIAIGRWWSARRDLRMSARWVENQRLKRLVPPDHEDYGRRAD
jgi:hypothetical protein